MGRLLPVIDRAQSADIDVITDFVHSRFSEGKSILHYDMQHVEMQWATEYLSEDKLNQLDAWMEKPERHIGNISGCMREAIYTALQCDDSIFDEMSWAWAEESYADDNMEMQRDRRGIKGAFEL